MYRNTSAVLATALLLTALVGCSPSDPSPTPIATVVAPTPGFAEGQTLWTITGTGESLPDDDPDVQAVRTLVTVHSGAIDNRGAESIDASIEKEFELYTDEFAGTLEGVGWKDAAQSRALEDGVTTEQRGLGWMQSEIGEDRASATAQYETYLVFTEASPEFLASNGIELGVEYTMLREVATLYRSGEWFISDVRESGLQPRTQAP